MLENPDAQAKHQGRPTSPRVNASRPERLDDTAPAHQALLREYELHPATFRMRNTAVYRNAGKNHAAFGQSFHSD